MDNKKEKQKQHVIARATDYFDIPKGPAIFMIDYDVNRYGVELTREEFMAILNVSVREHKLNATKLGGNHV